MNFKVDNLQVVILKKENGEKLIIPPNSTIRFIIDATKVNFDQWFIDNFYHKCFDEKNNTYIFDMICCEFKKTKVTGHLVNNFTVIPTLDYKSIIDISVVSDNLDLDIIKYALEYLHDADLSDFGEDNVKALEKTMDNLGIDYQPF